MECHGAPAAAGQFFLIKVGPVTTVVGFQNDGKAMGM